MGLLLLIIVIVLLMGGLPTWGYSRNWGYGPSGVLGLVLLVVVVLLFMGVPPAGPLTGGRRQSASRRSGRGWLLFRRSGSLVDRMNHHLQRTTNHERTLRLQVVHAHRTSGPGHNEFWSIPG